MRLLVASVAMLILSAGSCAREGELPRVSEQLRGPISLTLDNDGRFADGRSWTLSVANDGTADLEIHSFPSGTKRSFVVTDAQFGELRALLAKERFFELKDEYGELVPDGSTQTLTVTCGTIAKTVTLHFLMNWVHDDPGRLHEPARAVRVWMHIRQWFDDPDAVNLKNYDQMVLDADSRRGISKPCTGVAVSPSLGL